MNYNHAAKLDSIQHKLDKMGEGYLESVRRELVLIGRLEACKK